jgi:hypothetical protein
MPRRRRVWPLWIALMATIAVGVGVIAFPTFYIMPFKPQRAAVMALALRARAAAPLVTALAVVACVALAIVLAVRSRRWWARGVAILLIAPVILGAWFARQNHFEWMFNPLTTPRYVEAAKAKFVQPDDIVMAVRVGGETVAYPIRQLGYHHIVNDVIGKAPIVATY